MAVAGSSLFKKADRRKKKLRLAIDGPAGSGKTLTALRFAMAVARHEAAKAGRPGQTRVAVIDTENGSASIYQGDMYDGFPIEFDVIELSEFSPTRYSEITREAARLGYDVLVIDSLSHAWSGKGGALELVDNKAAQNKGNTFSGWKDITPLQNEMIETIVRSSCHVFSTMRTKTEWVLEVNEKGKSVPRKVGMAPVQRQGVEYEFDIVLDIDEDHIARVTKSRCSAIADKASSKPGAEFIGAVISWLDQGSDVPQEILDRAAMFDAPPEPTHAATAATQQPAAVGTDDLAARMAAKKAAAAAAQGGAVQGTTTNAPVSNAVATPAPVATAAPVAGTANSPSLADKTPAAGAATTQANSAGGTTQAVTTTSAPSVSDNQTTVAPLAPLVILAEISALFDKLEAAPDQRQVSYTKRNATSLETLTPEAALSLLGGLRNIVAEKYPGFAYTPATVTHVTPTGPTMVTGEQVDRIRKLFTDLQVPEAARIQALQRRGASAVSDLTEERANDLIHGLMGKLSGFENLPAFHPHFPETPIYANDAQRKLAESMKVPFDGGKPGTVTPATSGAA